MICVECERPATYSRENGYSEAQVYAVMAMLNADE